MRFQIARACTALRKCKGSHGSACRFRTEKFDAIMTAMDEDGDGQVRRCFQTAPTQCSLLSKCGRACCADFVRGVPGVVSPAGGRDGAGQEGRASQGQPAA